MELEVAVTIGTFATILSIIGYKITSRYLTLEHNKATADQKATYEKKIMDQTNLITSQETSIKNYRWKVKNLRDNYDIDFDDDEFLDGNVQTDELIPAIAQAIYPKMPKKMLELLGRDDIQDAIFKVAEKNPDKISDWVSKFFSKNEESKSKTTVLKENYL